MPLTPHDVSAIADYARIGVTDDELAELTQYLNDAIALLDAMIFDIVFGLFANAANQTMLQMTMTYQAKRLGLLHRRKQLS